MAYYAQKKRKTIGQSLIHNELEVYESLKATDNVGYQLSVSLTISCGS